MGLFGFLESREAILGLDIGASGAKLVELDLSGVSPRLTNLAHTPLSLDSFSSYAIGRPETVAEQIAKLLESNEIKTKLAATAVPGPSVFTKKIKMPQIDRDELAVNINMEAANIIPHNIDQIKLDYQVIGESGKNQLDILVVAVKTEIIESFIEALLGAGLETGVVDVDTFALQTAFEHGHSKDVAGKTVALVHVGARYACVNICKDGQSLFTGDVAVGGKGMTEGIATELGISLRDADEQKRKGKAASDAAKAAIAKQVEQVTSELNRQLSFFWNASGAEEGIDRIVVSGGGSMLPGFIEALGTKTGIGCTALDPFKGIDTGSVDPVLLKELSPMMAVAVGLALRQPGDKIFPDGM